MITGRRRQWSLRRLRRRAKHILPHDEDDDRKHDRKNCTPFHMPLRSPGSVLGPRAPKPCSVAIPRGPSPRGETDDTVTGAVPLTTDLSTAHGERSRVSRMWSMRDENDTPAGVMVRSAIGTAAPPHERRALPSVPRVPSSVGSRLPVHPLTTELCNGFAEVGVQVPISGVRAGRCGANDEIIPIGYPRFAQAKNLSHAAFHTISDYGGSDSFPHCQAQPRASVAGPVSIYREQRRPQSPSKPKATLKLGRCPDAVPLPRAPLEHTLHRQTGSSLAATPLQHLSPATGRHSRSETVRPRSFNPARLISTFHLPLRRSDAAIT